MTTYITALLAEYRENPPPPNPNPRPLTMDRAELKAAQAKRGLISRWLSDDALDWPMGPSDAERERAAVDALEDEDRDELGELLDLRAEPFRRESA